VITTLFPLLSAYDPAELDRAVCSLVPSCTGTRTFSNAQAEHFLAVETPALLDQLTQDAVTAVVAAHAGPASPLKLLRYITAEDRGRSHVAIDYKTGLNTRLHRKLVTMFRGEIREVHYTDPDDYDDIILRVGVVYVRSANGLATSRTTTRTWVREDGSDHPATKVTVKDYASDPVLQMQEGARRRQNVIDKLSIDVLGMLAYTQTGGDIAAAEVLGAAFMLSHNAAVTTFLRAGANAQLQADVTADVTAWLNNDLAAMGMPGVSIRQVILGSLLGISE
jgi:hypothetical protein